MYYLGSNLLDLELNKNADTTVYLNVGGKRFEVLWNTLGQYTSSRNHFIFFISPPYYDLIAIILKANDIKNIRG